MFALNSLRHSAVCSGINSARRNVLLPSTHHLRSCRLIWKSLTKSPALARVESTATARAQKTPNLKYPEWLNVYRVNTGATVIIGLCGLTSCVIFLVGSILYAPGLFLSPDHSNFWIPVAVFGSAVPAVALSLTTGPVVHSVKVLLPTWARRSRENLIRFADNTPLDTRLQLSCIRFKPYPTRRDVTFANLRKIRPSFRTGLTNLEHLTDANQYSEHSNTIWEPVVRRFMGQYWISTEGRNRSAAPGVWEKMWQQIPRQGGGLQATEKGKIGALKNKKSSVTMMNRKPSSTLLRTVPPPQRPTGTSK